MMNLKNPLVMINVFQIESYVNGTYRRLECPHPGTVCLGKSGYIQAFSLSFSLSYLETVGS